MGVVHAQAVQIVGGRGKKLVGQPAIRDAIFIAKEGLMSLREARSLSPSRRLAYVVILADLNGFDFNWETGAMKMRKADADI